MYNDQYYKERKDEIRKEIGILIAETYYEIERLVAKKIKKQQDLQKKLLEIELKEKASKAAEAKKKKEEKQKKEKQTKTVK